MWCFLFVPLLLSFFLIVWFDTDAVYEYLSLFRLNNICSLFRNFCKIKDQESSLNLNEYLLQYYYNSFVVRLITCEVCLSTWLGYIFSFIFTSIWYFHYGKEAGFVCLISSLCYPYVTLFSYRLIKKLH